MSDIVGLLTLLNKILGDPLRRFVRKFLEQPISRIRSRLYRVAARIPGLDRYLGLNRYLKCLEDTMERVRNPWLKEGQKLRNIIVPISTRATHHAGDRIDLKEVFEQIPAGVIVGDPGSGKTTALKAGALACIRRRYPGLARYVPVYVELRKLMRPGTSLERAVVSSFQENGVRKPRVLDGSGISKARFSG